MLAPFDYSWNSVVVRVNVVRVNVVSVSYGRSKELCLRVCCE